MASEIRRLHPMSWVFITASSVRGLIFPVVLVLFASSSNSWARYELLSLLIVVPVFVGALLKQGIYNYRFEPDELVIRDGILTKKERHIPYDRVHNVALIRNPFHRMLGVASAKVETAAGGEVEAMMQVLSLDAVEELREFTLGKRSSGEVTMVAEDGTEVSVPAEPDDLLLHVPTPELVLLGLISNKGFVVVAAVFGALSQVEWWDQDWQGYYQWGVANAPLLNDQAQALLQPSSWTGRILLGLGLLALFVVMLRVFSVIWYVLKYHDFTLTRDDVDLRAEYGMLTKVSSLIPVDRIQLMSTKASLLHRWTGRTGIDMETAGGSGGGGDDFNAAMAESGIQSSRQWVAPIIDKESAEDLIFEITPDIDLRQVDWQPIAPKAAGRILRKSILVVTLITGSLVAALSFAPVPGGGFQGLWFPAVLVPLLYFGVTGWVRNAAWALTDNAVFFRSGWLARKISIVRFNKVQTVQMSESPFDRRHRMASVQVDTAGAGSTGHRIDIPYIDIDVARSIKQRLYDEACVTEYSW